MEEEGVDSSPLLDAPCPWGSPARSSLASDASGASGAGLGVSLDDSGSPDGILSRVGRAASEVQAVRRGSAVEYRALENVLASRAGHDEDGYASDHSDDAFVSGPEHHRFPSHRNDEFQEYKTGVYHQSQSDGAISDEDHQNVRGLHHEMLPAAYYDSHGKKRLLQSRLNLLPSRARFPGSRTSNGRQGASSATAKLPRKIPRRVKGKYRRVVAERGEDLMGRIAVCCISSELDLDAVYAHISEAHQRHGIGNGSHLSEIERRDSFRIENNKSTIFPPFHFYTTRGMEQSSPSHLLKDGSLWNNKRDTIDSSSWTPSIFFDVLHLRQRIERPSAEQRREHVDEEHQAPTENQFNFDPDNVELELYPQSEFREVFLFGFGALVFWNWDSEDHEKRFVRSIVPYARGLFEDAAAESASDDIEFFCGKKSSVRNDTVELASKDPVERLAVSFAFAQSSLLSVYEYRLDKIIERNEHIPVTLAREGKIQMSQTEISKEIGRLFMERNMINLESDILGTPEFFWQNDEYDPVFRLMIEYMEQEDRLEILNKRLDTVGELLDVLSTQIENQHASKLEIIIIVLITCEVVVQVVWGVFIKDILGFFNHCDSEF